MPLKKFPEIIFDASKLDGNDTTNTYTQAGYTVTASSDQSQYNLHAWRIFDGNTTSPGNGWASQDGTYYDGTSPANSYTGTTHQLGTGTAHGEWLKLELPHKIKVSRFTLYADSGSGYGINEAPKSYKIYGSVLGSSWTELKDVSGEVPSVNGNSHDITNTTAYKYLGIVVTQVNTNQDNIRIGELKYYGTEEPAPPGDLSLDTTLKSTFNSVRSNNYVMYFDGEDPAAGNVPKYLPSGSVKSITPNNVVFDATNNCWTLDGSTESNVTTGSLGLVGDAPHTVSTWINASNLEANATTQQLFSIGSGYSEEIVRVDDTQIAANTWHNVTYAYQGEGGSKVTYVDGRKVEEAQVEDTFGDYPPFAMTGYKTGGYCVSASDTFQGYYPYLAFNKLVNTTADYWFAGDNVSGTTDGYTGSVGGDHSYIGSDNLGGYTGIWVKLEMLHKLALSYVEFYAVNGSMLYTPRDFFVIGSNDDITWDLIHRETSTAADSTFTSGRPITTNSANNHNKYKYIAIVIDRTVNDNRLGIGEIKLYGHKEGDLTRFPEPTRVLKYPHIAMTGPGQRGYVASASTRFSHTYDPYNAFNNDASGNDAWVSGPAVHYDNSASGAAKTSGVSPANPTTAVNGDGTTATDNYLGQFLQIELPHKVKATKFRLASYTTQTNSYRAPKNGVIAGSNNGTTWDLLHKFDNQTSWTTGSYNEYTVTGTNANTHYKYFIVIITSTNSGTGGDGYTTIHEFDILGTQEDTGTPAIVGGPFAGKVANFRVYDQYLGDERIQEIYDAQKDAFGHKKSSMTFYKGRIGVGTTEPEGALTVVDEPNAVAKFPSSNLSADYSFIEGEGCIKISTAGSSGSSGSSGGYGSSGFNAFDGLTSTCWSSTPTRHTRVSEEVDFGAWLKIQTPESMSLKKAEIESKPDWMQVGATFQGVGVGHQLGDTVACNKDGTRIAIAEPATGGTITAAQDGRVRIYDWNGSEWTQVGQNLTGTQSDYYGAGNMGFSDDGHRFITSSPNDGTSGGATPNAGVVEVYYLSGATWTILGTPFTSSDGGAQVGKSCAISGDGNTIAFVEYKYDDTSGVGVNAGRTRVFTWNGTTWVQKGLDMIGDVSGDEMGRVMEMTSDGNYVIIGNYSASSNNGKVWIYAWNGSAWVKRGNTLVGTGADLLGFDVTISDDANTIAIGENHNDDKGTEAGAVEIRTWNGSAYVLTQTLYDAEETTGRFGSAVALSGDGTRLVAVTHHSPDGSGSAHGRARVFEYYGGLWQLRQPFTSIGAQGNAGTDGSGSALGQEDGLAVSRDGSVIVVGLKNDDTSGNANSGQAKVFHMPSNIKSIWGSNDDTNWTKITTGNETFRGNDRLEFKNLDNPNYYKYHAIVADAFTQLKDVKLFGIRNQGSSTLHDGTLTLTKKVTAPQLESTGIINMKGDYTEIRANSNVVTEFNRSKKLIKYPRVAMTDNSSGGYVASASSTYTNFNPYEAFDNEDPGSTAYWSGSTQIYNTNGTWGGGTAAAYTTNVEGVSKYGEWIQIQLPNKIKYNYSKIKAPSPAARQPRDGYILGSNDTSGAWTILHRFEDVSRSSTADLVTYTPPSEYTQFFQYFRLVIETINDGGLQYVGVNTWDIFGCPEYDPEAHGTDVTVKSVANVPNTDWLEVYYDGQDYTEMPATVDNKTGVSTYDATSVNSVGFDATQKAFTFDAASSQYLSSSTPVDGNYIHSISIWFKGTNLTPTAGDTLMWIGDNVNNERIEIYLESDKISYSFKDNDVVATPTLSNNRWYHLTVTYNGVAGVTGREIYLDGVKQSATHTGNSAVLAVDNNTLNLGGFSGTSSTYMFSGSIANFRLFNRTLTSDEIYQLYAYQKEDFGHGNLGMTLKAGRLGIGTSEPRAALDVRGDAFFNGLISSGMPAIFGAVNNANYVQQSAISQNISVVQFSQGPNMERAAGGITCPIAGMYQVQLYTHCWFSGGAYAVKSTQTLDRYNSAGTIYSKANRGSIHNVTMGSSGGNSDQHQITTWLIQVNAGDYLILNHLTSPSTTRNYSNEWNYISAVCVCANNQSLGGGGGSGGGY
jgi:hypothetical protein